MKMIVSRMMDIFKRYDIDIDIEEQIMSRCIVFCIIVRIVG